MRASRLCRPTRGHSRTGQTSRRHEQVCRDRIMRLLLVASISVRLVASILFFFWYSRNHLLIVFLGLEREATLEHSISALLSLCVSILGKSFLAYFFFLLTDECSLSRCAQRLTLICILPVRYVTEQLIRDPFRPSIY